LGFDNLGLNERLLQGVQKMGYTEPTPIQERAIPLALEGRDIIGCAQTGTGKTAAFVLPTLQRIPHGQGTQALVVTPTRELALQIYEVATTAAKSTGHTVAAIYGGVGYEPQRKALKRGVDLLVATPGRLLDLVGSRDVDLSRVQVLVLDEADRMLDMGFWPQVRKIVAHVPDKRQNLLFSATMDEPVLRVIASMLDNPARVDVAPPATPIEAIKQAVYPVNALQKTDLLVHLIREEELTRVLVFMRTKHRAERVARSLEKHAIKCAVIHGNRTQSQRQQALDGFKAGRVRVLVATDIVARGIDVDNISHVVNYDVPNNAEDYVHRIGRTARAGASGSAVTFVDGEEIEALRDIEILISSVIPTEDLDGFAYTERIVPNPDRLAKRAPRPMFSSGVQRKARSRRIGPRR
jgi:ATP-dependent RNA helicase RhlE